MNQVTFYGHFTGWSSYPTACKRLARHLLQRDVALGLVNHRRGPCEGFEYLQPGSPQAPIGLFHGFADGLVRVPRHKRMVGYHVGDVDALPKSWVDSMNRLDLVITQSSWCAQVFRKCGVRTPIKLSRAGLDEAFATGPERTPNSPLRVAHFNSSEQWWRKGTAEVILAMQHLAGSLPIRVEVHTDHPSVRHAVERASAPGLVLAPPHPPMPPEAMSAALRGYDLLLSPSRAEGFGCQPMEALACGIPVVSTTCTGFSETIDVGTPGLVAVPVGPLGLCGTFGRAPTLRAEDIVEALRHAVRCYPALLATARQNATKFAAPWRWDTILTTDRFVDLVLAG